MNGYFPSQTAPRGSIGGCLFAFFLPPMSVLFLGLMVVDPSLNSSIREHQTLDPAPVRSSTQQIAPLFTSEVRYWEKEILTWADQWDLDPNLIAVIIQIESCGDPKAKSPAGATGLFQVMPYHFVPGENPYRPEINARRGLVYLKRSLKAFSGNIRLALAGYNAGISGASRPESLWPEETLRYVSWGERIYADARENKRSSQYLNDWLEHGGAYLCTRAQKEQSKR